MIKDQYNAVHTFIKYGLVMNSHFKKTMCLVGCTWFSLFAYSADERSDVALDSVLDSVSVYEIKVSGLINVEAGYLTGEYNNQESELKYQLRKAKFEVEQVFLEDITSNIEVSIDNEYQLSVSQASINYHFLNEYNVTAGLFKNAIGLQNSTGGKKIKTMERSLLSNALIDDSGLSLSLDFNVNDTYVYSSVFQSTPYNEGNTLGLSVRVAQQLILEGNKVQLGLNADIRNYDNYLYQLGQKAELNLAKKSIEANPVLLESTRFISADVALIHKKLTVQAELMSKSLDVNTILFGTTQHTYDGFYVKSSYLLSDKKRKFKNGAFAKTKLGDTSAIELVSRYSVINIKANTTSTYSNALVGVNYYFNANFKMMSQVSALNDGEETSLALAIRGLASF